MLIGLIPAQLFCQHGHIVITSLTTGTSDTGGCRMSTHYTDDYFDQIVLSWSNGAVNTLGACNGGSCATYCNASPGNCVFTLNGAIFVSSSGQPNNYMNMVRSGGKAHVGQILLVICIRLHLHAGCSLTPAAAWLSGMPRQLHRVRTVLDSDWRRVNIDRCTSTGCRGEQQVLWLLAVRLPRRQSERCGDTIFQLQWLHINIRESVCCIATFAYQIYVSRFVVVAGPAL